MICKKHPTYQGLRYPSGRPPCLDCVRINLAGGTVAALFIDPDGPYPQMEGVDWWDETRDARLYEGPFPVVCHSPCHLWTNMTKVNYKRYKDRSPEHEERLRPGNDQGCFASALDSLIAFGGVLEHPAGSTAFDEYQIPKPRVEGWCRVADNLWVCEVWQVAYGHKARKRTWLAYCGKRPPFELNWERREGTHQIGWFDRKKKTLGKKEASRTPQAFADDLVKLARWSRGK